MLRKAGLLGGQELVERSKASAMGSAASPNVPTAEVLNDKLAPFIPELKTLIDKGTVPILSCEGWGQRAPVFSETRFVEKLGGGARAVMYVRPPVDWVNSAWWQWGVWTPASLDTFIQRRGPSLRWHVAARAWEAVPGVQDVRLGLATRDVTPQFYDMLGAPAPETKMANSGVPASFMMFLLRNRAYRPDAHTPRTELVVAHHLPRQRYATPWVVKPEQVRKIFDVMGDMPKRLRNRLSAEDRALMDDDPRWWTPDAYADREVDDLTALETPAALAELVGMLQAGLGDDRADAESRARDRIESAPADSQTAVADKMIAAAIDQMYKRMGVPNVRKA